MFNQLKLKEVISNYKQTFETRWDRGEKSKWVAVKSFQDNWDLNADNFAEMLFCSLKKATFLMGNNRSYPVARIVEFAKADPEQTRKMFRELFDESKDVYLRINNFKKSSKEMLKLYGNGRNSHFQDENTITTYLWLRYPDKYYIFKISELKVVAPFLEADYNFKDGDFENNIRQFLLFFDEINYYIKKDTELINLFHSKLIDSCYRDPQLKTLTVDIGFFIYKFFNKERNAALTSENKSDINYWWLNANPKIWSFSNLAVGEVKSYSLYNENGNKRHIFQNFLDAKVNDKIICYESNPVKQIVALGRVSSDVDNDKLYIEKTEGLVSPIDYAYLKSCPELVNMEFFQNPNGTLFKLTENEYNYILDVVREENPKANELASDLYSKSDFLKDVYVSEETYDSMVSVLYKKKNIILQGAPGVGKTFIARRLAWSLMEEKDDSRIEFIQFHQNYSYEDFVIGYKPDEEGFKLKHGVFYRFCQKAINQPDKDFFFIIDEINRGNMSKIFGELLMLIERDYRDTAITLAYGDLSFYVPNNLYIIGMMNTADRSLAIIDYALRRRFSFFEIKPAFESDGFIAYQNLINNNTFNTVISKIKELNEEIINDRSLGKGFCIGHSYFCNIGECSDKIMKSIIDYDIIPMLEEYWFDDDSRVQRWKSIFQGIFK